jgi:Mg-chelatase subunit ChlD
MKLTTAAIVGMVCAGAAVQQSPYRSRTDVVLIDAVVTDRRKPVTHLTKDDFELRDNNVVQQILDASRETFPLDVTVVVDISGSMSKADRAVVERAIGQVSAALRPVDRAAVVAFGAHISERTPLGHPPIPIDLSVVGSGTAVFDALLISLVTPPAVDRRQLVLLMTDGQDTASYFDGQVVVETARYASASTSIVLVPNRASLPMRGVLHAVASTTGGEVIELKRNDELSRAFLAALESFRTSYVLRYAPAGVTAAGWHDIAVMVKGRDYVVRARRGYRGF